MTPNPATTDDGGPEEDELERVIPGADGQVHHPLGPVEGQLLDEVS